MLTIHHATAKKAAKANVELRIDGQSVVATTGPVVISAADAATALTDALTARMLAAEYPRLSWSIKGGIFLIKQGKATLASGDTLTGAWELAAETLGGGGEDQGDEEGDEDSGDADEGADDATGADDEADADEDEDEDLRRSVIKAKYKKRYQPFKGRCGSSFADKLSTHVANEDGGVDFTKLVRFAEANGVWKDSYAKLKTKDGGPNFGMMRMNVGNRCNGLIKKGKEIIWA